MALDVKVLTENKEELALKDLIESDIDDIPYVREKDERQEVGIDDLSEDIPETVFEDTEMVDLDDELNFTKGMFEDDDDEIDTTIPDGDLFEDDFDDLDEFDVEDEE